MSCVSDWRKKLEVLEAKQWWWKRRIPSALWASVTWPSWQDWELSCWCAAASAFTDGENKAKESSSKQNITSGQSCNQRQSAESHFQKNTCMLDTCNEKHTVLSENELLQWQKCKKLLRKDFWGRGGVTKKVELLLTCLNNNHDCKRDGKTAFLYSIKTGINYRTYMDKYGHHSFIITHYNYTVTTVFNKWAISK